MKLAYVGIHNYEIPPHDTYFYNKISYSIGLLYNAILGLVKVSVLAFLLRLARIQPVVKYLIWALIVVTVSMTLTVCALVAFPCNPVEMIWTPGLQGSCFDLKTSAIWTASVNIFTDILVLALPFYIFIRLRMPRQVKIALLCVFGLGAM
jgi:hypothetical protein